MAAHFFFDSDSLRDYVKLNDITVWHGDIGFGTLLSIDTHDLHVVFDSRKDYESWCDQGRPVQLSLF